MQSNPTIAAYNKYAHVYDSEVVEFWDNFPKEFLREFVSLLSGKRVLNIGSGTGRDALLLKDLGLEVICVDASKSMVDITKELGFESYLADFSNVDFPTESFDGIWAYTSLIHVPKKDARLAIKKFSTLLKPDGIFAIGVIQGDTAGMVERKTMPGSQRYFKNYTKQELKDMIEPIGFTLKFEVDYQPHNSIYLNQLYRLN